MEKEINRRSEVSGQPPVENNNLPDDGELNEEDLEQVNGGSLKLMAEMLNNVSKIRSEISMTFAKNARA